jgi:hypothetical protein
LSDDHGETLTSHEWLDHPVGMKPARLSIAILVAMISVIGLGVAHAQRYMQVEGWVQWVAADRMQLVLDNGLSISVDLTRVPQREYQSLGPGQRDRVVVVGYIAPDNRRFIASSVARTSSWGYESP